VPKMGNHLKCAAPKLVSKWAQSYTYVQHSALGGCQSERPKRMGRYPWNIFVSTFSTLWNFKSAQTAHLMPELR
jgi:hypothetical protein